MLGIQSFETFLVASIILNLIPGPDTFYILGRSLAQGRSVGVASALGISGGALVHTFAAAFGLSALITASATAFMIVKLAGAAYLIYLGIKMILNSKSSPLEQTSFETTGAFSAFKQGLVTNTLNPKVAMFFLAFLPQFISEDANSPLVSFLALGATFVTTSTIWCVLLAWSAAIFSKNLREKPNYLSALNKGTGILFVGLGTKLAMDK